jgi:RNA polymerase sigma-70 factor (ECF subfamily)
MDAEPDTVQLLRRWHGGDRKALDALLERDLPWIRERVRRRLGPLLKAKGETEDFVQDAVLEVLRYAPPFVLGDRAQFRALLARIAENVLRDRHDRYAALRRALHRERPLPAGADLDLGPPCDSSLRPSRMAERGEWERWVRLGLELLDPDERELVLLREWDGLRFPEIGARLGVSEDAARMRFHRALAHLADRILRLRSGRVAEVVGVDPDEKGGEREARADGAP